MSRWVVQERLKFVLVCLRYVARRPPEGDRKAAAIPSFTLHLDTMRAMESWCGRLCCLMVAALASCFDYRAGLTRTIAGSSSPGYVDGAGTSARFASIQSVAWTPAANFLVVVESGYNVIRRIDAMSGETITLAGGLNDACVESDGVGSDAQFCCPAKARMAADGPTMGFVTVGPRWVLFTTHMGFVTVVKFSRRFTPMAKHLGWERASSCRASAA